LTRSTKDISKYRKISYDRAVRLASAIVRLVDRQKPAA
jgi:hypothetical protein